MFTIKSYTKNTKIGMGRSLQDPLYGLLDIDLNFFYVVDYRKHVIEQLHNLIGIHKTVTTIPLHACKNWYLNKIDNTVCHNWGTTMFDSEMRSLSLKQNDISLTPNGLEITDELKFLIQNCQETSILLAAIVDQSGKPNYVASEIIYFFANDPWVQKANNIEKQTFDNKKTQLLDMNNQLKSIMTQCSIDSADYCKNLNKLATPLIKKLYQLAYGDIIYD
jgi:hypothetical protein